MNSAFRLIRRDFVVECVVELRHYVRLVKWPGRGKLINSGLWKRIIRVLFDHLCRFRGGNYRNFYR